MNFSSFIEAAFDSRNHKVAATLMGEAAEVAKDGRVTPQELIDAGATVGKTALDVYGVGGTILLDLHGNDAASKVLACTDRIGEALRNAVSDKEVTADEVLELCRVVSTTILRELGASPGESM